MQRAGERKGKRGARGATTAGPRSSCCAPAQTGRLTRNGRPVTRTCKWPDSSARNGIQLCGLQLQRATFLPTGSTLTGQSGFDTEACTQHPSKGSAGSGAAVDNSTKSPPNCNPQTAPASHKQPSARVTPPLPPDRAITPSAARSTPPLPLRAARHRPLERRQRRSTHPPADVSPRRHRPPQRCTSEGSVHQLRLFQWVAGNRHACGRCRGARTRPRRWERRRPPLRSGGQRRCYHRAGWRRGRGRGEWVNAAARPSAGCHTTTTSRGRRRRRRDRHSRLHRWGTNSCSSIPSPLAMAADNAARAAAGSVVTAVAGGPLPPVTLTTSPLQRRSTPTVVAASAGRAPRPQVTAVAVGSGCAPPAVPTVWVCRHSPLPPGTGRPLPARRGVARRRLAITAD